MASVDLQEKANFTRLSRLLVDKGTEALRNTFDTIHPPVSLPGVLAKKKISLQKLKPRVINNSQWDLLFPQSGNSPDSKTFDVTLLTVLFRNICGFPSTGWGVMPPDTDRSTQANITRIKCYRNEVIGHVTTTRVDNSTFESLWKKISQALVELGIPQSDIDDLEKCPLGPEEKIYVQMLVDWKLREDECIKMLATMTQIEETRDRVNLLCQSLLKKSENEIPQTSLKRTLSIPEDAHPEKKFCKKSGEDVLRKLAKHNFKNEIKRKVKFFLPGTREWLLKEVDEWFCSSDSDSRIKLITAGPGFGKSVFAAKICEDFEKKGKMAACHFCDFSNSNLRDPMMMLQSLASQMCQNVPGFKEKLLDQLKRPHQVQNLRDAFEIYLQNPLDELEIKEPRLVVIDGLDESAADNKNEITHLIAEYFPDLPEYIKILVTSRPEISVADLRLRDDQKTDISNVHDNNNSDLELYFKECFPSLVGKEVDRKHMSDDFYEDHPYLCRFWQIKLFSIFVAKCQGSFLYAYHFQSGLRARYDLEKITNNDVMEFLPKGLHSVYERYFKRLEDELSDIKQEKFDVLNILAMLAASKGYLPLTFVAQAFGLAPDCRETKDIMNKINEAVSCLLYVSDDMLTVFHKSIIDWLLAKGYKDHQYTVKIDDGHRSLWLLCENIFKEIKDKGVRSGLEMKFTNDVEYALNYGLKHLEKCEMEEGVFWSVDIIIVCYMLTVIDSDELQRFWLTLLQCSWIKNEELRARISYHIMEFESLELALEPLRECYNDSKLVYSALFSQSYLQAVLTRSPKGYFSDDEKKIAETLLSNLSPFVESKSYEVSVLPRAFWKRSDALLEVELGVSQNEVDELKTSSLDPDDETYVKKFERVKISEENQGECDETRDAVNETRDAVYEMRQSLAKRALLIPGDTNPEKKSRTESDEDLLRKLAKHNFRSKIQRNVKLFYPGTREWLLREVDEWFCSSDSDSRIKLITAGPGFGKSVLAAKICEDFRNNGKLAACHFCDFSDGNLRDPMMMLQSLASQMCENVPGFKERLLHQLKRPHQVQNLKDAFLIYLQNPLDELEIKEPRLVVIDGLDESAADNKNKITHLIAECFPDLHEYIKILVTSRPEISVADLRLRDEQKTDISNVDANNNSDLELYFKECLPSLVGRKVNQSDVNPDLYENPYICRLKTNGTISFLSIFVAKCQGSFLYANYFQTELRRLYDLGKITNNEAMEFLPKSLNSIYEGYFKRLEDELQAIKPETFDVLKILEMLAASKGPLPLTFVAQAFGLAPDCRETKDIINKINETVSCLLYVSDDMLTVFHKSFIDWLLAKGYKDHQYTIKIDDGNKLLWLLCENVFEEIVIRVCSGLEVNLTNDVKYALKHGLEHLEQCEMEEGVFWSVDLVILYFMLTLHPDEKKYINHWSRLLRSSGVKNEGLRARISWHIIELDLLYPHVHFSKISRLYLKAVSGNSPKGYFSDDEKKIAELLLSNVSPFVESNSYEVSVLPRAVWKYSDFDNIRAVALSNDEKSVAVGRKNFIHVISLPTLVEIMNYSTKLERISCCIFSPDDSLILFGKLGTAFNIAGRKEVPFFPGNEETFLSCAFSTNGKRLVTSDGSNTVKLWDVAKQTLLSSLCAGFLVGWCSFSVTGLFIIANSESSSYPGYSFCVWNAITLHRSDKRKLSHVEREKPDVLKSRKCERCFQRGFEEQNSKHLEIRSKDEDDERSCIISYPWICKGVECIFSSEEFCYSSDTESIPLTAIVAWNYLVAAPRFSFRAIKIPTLEDNLWLYSDNQKLIVFKTLVPKQVKSCLSQPTEVYSSSFSSDGSRLASCNSDGYINVWNVCTNQVEQRFERNQGGSEFFSWWSENFFFVFDLCHGIPTLTRCPVVDNSNILFTQSQQASLYHLKNELSAVVDFSEGFLSFKCGEKNPTKFLDVSGMDGPVIIELPGVEPMMRFTFSPGGTFVFGTCEDMYYIWKRNIENSGLYAVFIYRNTTRNRFKHLACCFSNDAKVAVVFCPWQHVPCEIIDLESGNSKNVKFDYLGFDVKLYCINKNKVFAVLRNYIVLFEIDSGAIIDYSFERHLTDDVFMKTKLSPMENMLAFPGMKGEMVFRELSKNSSDAKN